MTGVEIGPVRVDADATLRELSTRQHLRPHRPLDDVLAQAAATLGFPCEAAERAVACVGLNGGCAVGRLTRAQLAGLARSLSRQCRHSLSGATDRQVAD